MPFCGLSLTRILTSVLILGSMMDLIAFRCNPERGSGLVWTFSQVAARLANLRNTSHRVADAICNNPEDCKHAIDEFFAYVSSIPQDVLDKIAELLRYETAQSQTKETQDGGIVQQQHREFKQKIADYRKEQAALNGSAPKAQALIKSLRFSSYEESNLCDLKEGIPPEKYNVTVDQIAALTNMPDKVKDVIKMAINLEGEVLALDNLKFKSKDGNMVFGKVVVIRRGKVMDLAYSLHAVEYELKAKQRQPENAEKLRRFTESLEEDEDEASDEISIDLREDFLAYFYEQAVRGFIKHCDVLLNTLNEENQKEVRRRMSLTNDTKDI